MKLLTLSFAILTSSVFALTDSGTLTLTGVIGETTSITVTPVAGVADNLDLTVDYTAGSPLNVASVNETSNAATGYNVTVSSANNGELVNGAVDSLAYNALYNGVAITLSTTPQTITNQATPGSYNVDKALDIYYTASTANLAAGTYTDTLTFTISNN